MHRRAFLIAGLAAAAAAPALAWAQSVNLRPITPTNELERVFLAAFADPTERPIFRRVLLQSQVALALATDDYDAPPRLLDLGDGREAGFVFTSNERLSVVLGPGVPRRIMSGRQALERLEGKHAVLNWRLAPMLTLEPADIESYLAREDQGPAL
jgi:hypothetical protein